MSKRTVIRVASLMMSVLAGGGSAALAAGGVAAGTPPVDIPSYGAAAARTLIALVVVVALLLIAAKLVPRWLNRRTPPPAGGEIEVVASCPIEPRRTLYIVKARGREYLVGSSEQGLHAISNGPIDGRPGPSFSEVLANGAAGATGDRRQTTREAPPAGT